MTSIINIKYKNVNNIKQDPKPEDKLFLNFDNSLKLDAIKTQLTVKCKCGHSVIIPVYEDKKLCTYCNNYVHNNTPMRFKYYFRKLKEGEKDE